MALNNHTLPSRVMVGDGASKSVGTEAKKMGATKVLLVSDKGVEGAGLVGPIKEAFEKAGLGCEVYLDVEPNPTDEQVRGADKTYKDGGCDFVVALGGGSVMDVAKAVRILAKHPGDILDFDFTKGGMGKITANQPPLICMSTTSGTGSEVSVGAIVTDTTNHTKRTIVSPFIVPTMALDDPLLTHGLPPFHTAATGMDALTHAIEAYTARNSSPLGAATAIRAIKMISENLITAVKEPNDGKARHNMMYAAMLAGIAFSQDGLGTVHATAHQLSTEFGFAHGMANAIMLVPVMKFNLDKVASKYAEVAVALGANPGQSESALAEEAIKRVEQLRADSGLPGLIREGKGAKAADLKKLAAQAMNDMCHFTNPKQCNPQVMHDLFAEAGADAA
ncbi:MAG: iron-containing alcohol dehydrogenase [Chrysiogenetes bacterium]|nr:iron-containing alcohol dehydrogenase [Chrysiogenetes bacterium]